MKTCRDVKITFNQAERIDSIFQIAFTIANQINYSRMSFFYSLVQSKLCHNTPREFFNNWKIRRQLWFVIITQKQQYFQQGKIPIGFNVNARLKVICARFVKSSHCTSDTTISSQQQNFSRWFSERNTSFIMINYIFNLH